MSEDWKPGDVAICINADKSEPDENCETPWPLRKYAEYIVTKAGIYQFYVEGGLVGIELEGIKRPFMHSAFGAWRFRKKPPLIEEKQAIREMELTQ